MPSGERVCHRAKGLPSREPYERSIQSDARSQRGILERHVHGFACKFRDFRGAGDRYPPLRFEFADDRVELWTEIGEFVDEFGDRLTSARVCRGGDDLEAT